MSSGTIVVLASLDTKADQSLYLVDRIQGQGFEVVLVNIGYGGPPRVPDLSVVGVTADEVAAAAGVDLAQVRARVAGGEAAELMTRGAAAVVGGLMAGGRCDGVIGFGGASNTSVATTVMQSIPVGVPKVMVSSAAAMPAYAAAYFGSRDITMINTVVDFAGLNDLTRSSLESGAGAVCGMVRVSAGPVSVGRSERQVAVTGFRFSEACTTSVTAGLEALGYTVIPFHAQGVGENAFEDLVAEGLFIGVIDIVPAGMSEHMLGGNRAARADRLEAAGRAGIPAVYATSGFDLLSCGPLTRRDTGDPLWVKRNLAQRAYHQPDRFRVQARTTADEVADIGRAMGHKLARAGAPARVVVAGGGWSSLSTQGQPLHDPDADAAFVPAFQAALGSGAHHVTVEEHELELNDPEFARILVDRFDQLIKAGPGSGSVPVGS